MTKKDLAWAKIQATRFKPTLQVLHSFDVEELNNKCQSELFIDMNGEGSFTRNEGKTKNITLGVTGIYDQFQDYVTNDGVWFKFLNYVRKHEICHVRYTGGRSWISAIEGGEKVIYQYIGKQLGLRSYFRNERDYKNTKKQILDNYGTSGVLLENTIIQTAHYIVNSLEDGRIERIQSGKEEGFAKDRAYIRGVVSWELSAHDFPDWEELENDSITHYQVIASQILNLATCQKFGRGFLTKYVGTPLMDEMVDIMPYIFEGYMGRSTRVLVDATTKICERLAPLIYEMADVTVHNIELTEKLKRMLEEMIRNQLMAMADMDEFGDSDADAEEDSSPLPFNDLEITLPDDVYDKLMDKMKKSSSSSDENSVTIKREHPLTPPPLEDDENEEPSNGSDSNSSEGNSGESSQENSDGNDSSATENDEGGKSPQSSNEEKGEQETKNTSSSESKEEESIGEEDEDSTQSSGNVGDKNQGNPQSKSSSSSSTGDEDDSSKGLSIEEIEKNAEEALKTVEEEFNADAESIANEISNSEIAKGSKKANTKVNPSTSNPITNEEVKDIISNNFKECKRNYKVDSPLPPILQAKGDALHKKIHRYFQGLKTPTVRYRTNGRLDKGGIARLAKNKINVFMKNSSNAMRKGCVYILIDNSGSMSDGQGSKRYKANMAAAIIEEGFKGLMPIKIVAFESRGEIIHHLVKDWDEVQHENCCWNYCIHGEEGWGNEDDQDIAVATYELNKRNEEKKLLIVLSDGAPSDTEATHDRIADARKTGIKVSGIYFEDGDVDPNGSGAQDFKYMYQKDYVCCNADEIADNLAKVLEAFSHSR